MLTVDIVLKHYQVYRSRIDGRPFYFNPKLDILFMENTQNEDVFTTETPSNESQQLLPRYLAFDAEEWAEAMVPNTPWLLR